MNQKWNNYHKFQMLVIPLLSILIAGKIYRLVNKKNTLSISKELTSDHSNRGTLDNLNNLITNNEKENTENKEGNISKKSVKEKSENSPVNQLDLFANFLDEQKNKNNLLLAETIISILVVHYVDPERIKPENLLTSLIENLNFEYNTKIVLNKDAAKLIIPSEKNLPDKTIFLPDTINYDSVVNLMALLSMILEKDLLKKSKESDLESIHMVINSLLSALDAHSILMSKKDYAELKEGTEGKFAGLGIMVGLRDNLLKILNIIPKSPASKSGLKNNDTILKVGDKFAYGYELSDLVSLMKGPVGSQVDLSILRDDSKLPLSFKLEREVINVESVSEKLITYKNHNYLYLKLDSFSASSDEEIKFHMKKHFKDNAPEFKGIVFDLRYNPGGLLDQAVRIADLFLKEGLIVSVEGRNTERLLATSSPDDVLDTPMILLINENSASASEILAGALQGNERVLVLGQNSFAKGSVQTLFQLPGEQALKLTISRFRTPKGQLIQNAGITPDIFFQPVYPLKNNMNLLGNYRYRNESFLSHRLSGAEGLYDSKSFLTGYYLQDLTQKKEPKDEENDFALELLSKINAMHTKEASSLKILTALKSTLEPEMKAFSEKTNRELRQKYKIDWANSSAGQLVEVTTKNSSPLRVNSIVFEKNTFNSGDSAKVFFEIENITAKEVSRASVFLKPDLYEINSSELLIGKIGPKAKYKSSIELQIPRHLESSNSKVQFGIALEGKPILPLNHELALAVSEKPFLELKTKMSLVEENGKIPGVLESNEKAKILIEIENGSNFIGKDISVSLVNLTGSQIKISEDREIIAMLKANGSAKIELAIEGSNKILSNALDIGIVLESSDLKNPFKKSYQFKALVTP